VRIPFAGSRAGKPIKGTFSSGGDGGGSDSNESDETAGGITVMMSSTQDTAKSARD